MRTFVLFMALLIGISTFSNHASASKKVWKVTTLEWGPFTCEKCPEGGAAIVVLRKALETQGIKLEVEFMPWSRAIKEAANDSYAGYYPAWPEDVLDGFVASPSLFKSPIGFVEPVAAPLGKLLTLNDLKGKTIGTVQDYTYTKEFIDLGKAGVYKAEVVVSDVMNLKKVAANRIAASPMDFFNARYMVQNEAPEVAGKIQFNSFVLANKDLHLAINGKKAKEYGPIIAAGLAKIDAQKIVDEYVAKHVTAKIETK